MQGFRRKLFDDRWFLRAAVAMGPAGFVAVICGWITAEAGRQPYTIYGLLRTDQSMSPVGAGQVSASLAVFLVVYAVVFSAGALYIGRLLVQGPQSSAPERDVTRAPGSPLQITSQRSSDTLVRPAE